MRRLRHEFQQLQTSIYLIFFKAHQSFSLPIYERNVQRLKYYALAENSVLFCDSEKQEKLVTTVPNHSI